MKLKIKILAAIIKIEILKIKILAAILKIKN